MPAVDDPRMQMPERKRRVELDCDGNPVALEDNKLNWAAQNGHFPAVQHWYDKGGNVMFRCKQALTPLHRCGAGWDDHPEIASFLLDKRADLNAIDDLQRTPIHWAVAKANTKVVALLLENAAQLHHKDQNDETPLDCARRCGNVKIIELLESASLTEEPEREAAPTVEPAKESAGVGPGESPEPPAVASPEPPAAATPATPAAGGCTPSTPGTPAARVAALEIAVHSEKQTGGLMTRLAQLEVDLLGDKSSGPVPGRLDVLEAALQE